MEFRLEQYEDAGSWWGIVPYIDGQSLLLQANSGGSERGGHGPLMSPGRPLARYFLGEMEERNYEWASTPDEDKARSDGIVSQSFVHILGCSCGDDGCGPLWCLVTQLKDVIDWSSIGSSSGKQVLGPYRFDRRSMVAAANEAEILLHEINPRPVAPPF